MVVVTIIFLLVIGLLIFFGVASSKNEELLEKRSEDRNSLFCGLYKHCVGLPVPEDCGVWIHQFEDKLLLLSNNSEFTIPYDRITNISYMSDRQVQSQYVSSAGGAIAGAMLLGPLGAFLGGRTKKKTDVEVSYYLIISYLNKDGELSSINLEDAFRAQSNKDLFLSHFSNNRPKDKEPVKMEL